MTDSTQPRQGPNVTGTLLRNVDRRTMRNNKSVKQLLEDRFYELVEKGEM